MKMDPIDEEKISFITERGTYCYKVIPFGLKNAITTYQHLTSKMFVQYLGKFIQVNIDDILVKSMKSSQHLQHLEENFGILNQYGMKFNQAKCSFGSRKFLGHIFQGIEVNTNQMKEILDMSL